MSQYDNDLVRMGIIHYKAGEYDAARRYLDRALMMADDHQTRFQANYYLGLIASDPAEKRRHLEEALAIDPNHGDARRAMAILEGKIRPEEIINPDALPEQSAETKTVQADRFTCPKCGARMVFDGDGRTLVCEYCSRNQTLDDQGVEEEQDFIVAMATGKGHRKPIAMQTFHCRGCGAEFLLPPTSKAAVCAYCASAHVIQGDSRELVEPDAIIPMAFKQREAVRLLVEWVQKNKIEPQGKVQPPRGVYMPVWTFDVTGAIPWNGRVYRNKKWVSVSGTQSIFLNDISVAAFSHHPELMKKLLTEYDFQNAPAYDPRYLVGWPAEVYQQTMSAASLDARQQAVHEVRKQVRGQFSDIADLSYSTANISIVSFKLVFTPVWVTEYPFEGQTFGVLINGATGAVHGETPNRGVLDWFGKLLGK